jgi:2',3'-cyclic-nucleotide 2'-phosphodiesterase (5'-nucleotidase family)
MKKFLIIIFIFSSLLVADELSINFTGNNRGLLEPCRCTIPSGGYARISTAIRLSTQAALNIAVGNQFFHHTPMASEDQIFEQKKADLQGALLSELNYKVINIGQFDLCYGLKALHSLQMRHDLNFISANILDMNGHLAFSPTHTIESNGKTILFVGVCYLSDGFNFKIKDPIQALIDLYHDGIFETADLVILLADTPSKMLSDFVEDYDGIDVIIGAKEHAFTEKPLHHGNTAFVQMGSQGKYFSTLKLHFSSNNSDWKDFSPQKNDTDHSDDGIIKKFIKKQRAKKMPNLNFYTWNTLLLDSSIQDDMQIKNRVDKLLQNK